MLEVIYLIPALPLVGFLLLALFGRRLGEPLAGIVATLMVGTSFLLGVVAFASLLDREASLRIEETVLFRWIPVGDFQVDVGFLADPLSLTWVLFVTGIATLIHIYAIGYMHGDERFHVFFAYLNLFVFSMLMLVLGNNFLLTFLGWEGVGACSYFLISFWFTNEANASAGKKAFVTNRVGDWGVLVGMFLVFSTFGSLTYTEVLPLAPGLAASTASLIAIAFFVGAVGKSAQLPLFVWLPDAMAGPTPVSALIHAATMVTAGVYLMVRINPVLAASDVWVGQSIAWVGALTALVAATIAIGQTDIKKVLAYSTISQLGFMFLAVGVGAYVAAVFHVITHAVFKALLFLGSGSVIHGMADDQDMRHMGGLRKYLPITHATFLVGWLAIAGLPPLAGFWSKDEILLFASQNDEAGTMLLIVSAAAALLTAVYMTRQYVMVFGGTPRWGSHAVDATATEADGQTPETADANPEESEALVGERSAALEPDFHPHESARSMTLPLVALACLAVVAGGLNLPFNDEVKYLEHWLVGGGASAFGGGLWSSVPFEVHIDVTDSFKALLAGGSALIAVAGIVIGFSVWGKNKPDPTSAIDPLAKGWYLDSALAWFFGGPGRKAAEGLAWFDKAGVDATAVGAGGAARGIGRVAQQLQTGLVRGYALLIALGAVALMGYVVVAVSL